MTGRVFDIKEFGLHDGFGLRTTVFMKGCPLSCAWCHNPEGIGFSPELFRNLSQCRDCGLCRIPCDHPDCQPFGTCLHVCPGNFVKVAGTDYTPEALAKKLLSQREFLEFGGVTFSGGEPLMQEPFLREVAKLLPGIPTAVETCGYVVPEVFHRACEWLDDIFIDLKLFDREAHLHWTGCPNDLILENISWLMEHREKFTLRIPLIPGVTDRDENLSAIAEFLKDSKAKVRVELIPYNVMTGAKYRSVGREYAPAFDEKQPLNKNTVPFESLGIPVIAF